MAADYWTAAQDIVGGVTGAFGDAISAGGYGQAEQAYKKAAAMAGQNAAITKRSTKIQQMQAQRQLYQGESAEQADTGAAGLSMGGSNQYLLRSSAEQGGLTHALVANQGLITENGYLAEQNADIGQANQMAGMQQAAQAQGAGGFLSGILGAAGSIFGL